MLSVGDWGQIDPQPFFYCLRAQISIIFCDKRAFQDISLVPIKSDSGWSTIKLKFIWVSGSRSRFFMWFLASRNCSIMSVSGSSEACCKENGIFCPFLDAKTDVLLVFGSRNWQTMSVYVLDQETDITDWFLDPETDIMGEGNFMGFKYLVIHPLGRFFLLALQINV